MSNPIGFQSAFGGVYGKCGTNPQGFDSLHDFLPGDPRKGHKKIM